jgi:Holliday junction resolvase RusA-like endonuclease
MEIFKLEINPIAKPRMVRSDKWKKRKATDNYWTYKDNLKVLAEAAKYAPEDGDQISFCLEMPQSWSKKKKAENWMKYHKQKPDLDNLLKGFWDALLEEDSVISSVGAVKFWSAEGRIEIRR